MLDQAYCDEKIFEATDAIRTMLLLRESIAHLRHLEVPDEQIDELLQTAGTKSYPEAVEDLRGFLTMLDEHGCHSGIIQVCQRVADGVMFSGYVAGALANHQKRTEKDNDQTA